MLFLFITTLSLRFFFTLRLKNELAIQASLESLHDKAILLIYEVQIINLFGFLIVIH